MSDSEYLAKAVAASSRSKKKERPLIRRPWIYDHIPQVPYWFCNSGHLAARRRFLKNLATRYRWSVVDACPNCGRVNLVHAANQERHGLPISVDLCLDCALVFTNPRLTEDSLTDLYKRDYRDIERGERSDIHEFMYSLQASKGETIWKMIASATDIEGRGIRIVDIGCGEGGLLGWISEHDKTVRAIGYELNIDAAEYGRERGLDVRTEQFSGKANAFDVVMLEQVLEHMHDPSVLVREIAATQPEGGLLYIGVPGILAYPSHYDGNFLTYLDYAHMYHFCLYTLERAIVPCGYSLVSGSEIVHAVFRRTDDPARAVVTSPIEGREMAKFLVDEEAKYRGKGSHFLRNKGGYKSYLGTLLLNLLPRWRGADSKAAHV